MIWHASCCFSTESTQSQNWNVKCKDTVFHNKETETHELKNSGHYWQILNKGEKGQILFSGFRILCGARLEDAPGPSHMDTFTTTTGM
ncbi:hypothetical protein AV530_016975 [Patagioenas fasciata monilis]|uniref:Uncharacterized protein n=1 Tax=Patagioenas fasciata monilis TaxID=372326 RepID=A0A1V4J479_PATFA|nr:hypothetical protein AV530_016975 [Patagioenas fasciata monilis]